MPAKTTQAGWGLSAWGGSAYGDPYGMVYICGVITAQPTVTVRSISNELVDNTPCQQFALTTGASMITLYTGANTQQLMLRGVMDQQGNAITGATITGTILQGGLVQDTVTFLDVEGQNGNYSALLEDFNAPVRTTVLQLDGHVPNGDVFSYQVSCQVLQRTL